MDTIDRLVARDNTLEKLLSRAESLMRHHLAKNPDATMTELAEDAAIELGQDEWLDDADHRVWEIAMEVRGEL